MREFAYVLSLASAFAPAAPAADLHCCGVIELRQYILHPGQRDVLVELFEREFIESQEALPIRLLGLFRDLDRPDRFVWLRGFADMPSRAQALGDFYGGPVWKAHRDAANATMIDSDDVLLLRPLDAAAGFPQAPLPARDAAPRGRGVVEARLLYAAAEPSPARVRAAVEALDAALREAGGTRLAVLVSEQAPNNFPRLPVREGEHVLAWFAALDDESARERFHAALAASPRWREAASALAAGAPRVPETLRLAPTARSRLPATRAVD
jgi:NIPSNAP protein